jgi:hypothetical protein
MKRLGLKIDFHKEIERLGTFCGNSCKENQPDIPAIGTFALFLFLRCIILSG